MIKICDEALVKPLLNHWLFPSIWKKSSIVPVYKKGDKQIIYNYRPISLLSISGKIPEKIRITSIYEFLEENDLLCEHQSGFRFSDFMNINYFQLHMTFILPFDYNPPLDVRGVFLDISKVCDSIMDVLSIA